MLEVLGRDGHRGAVRGGVAHDHDAVVVRDVEPLVRVGGPRVGELGAVEQRALGGAGARPEAERAVDVQPAAALVHDAGELAQRVDRAAVHVAGLRADDERAVESRECVAQRVGAHPPLPVGRHDDDTLRPEPEHAQRRVNRHVRLGADDDVDARRAVEAVRLHVPAHFAQDAVPRRGERGEVRHLAAGHEADAGAAREAEELEEPRRGDLLADRVRRRRGEEAGVLVPRRGEPVGRERDRQRAADDEAEVARPGAADDARIGAGRERVDDGGSVLAVVRQRHREGAAERVAVGARADVAVRKGVEKAGGMFDGALQRHSRIIQRKCLPPPLVKLRA